MIMEAGQDVAQAMVETPTMKMADVTVETETAVIWVQVMAMAVIPVIMEMAVAVVNHHHADTMIQVVIGEVEVMKVVAGAGTEVLVNLMINI